MDLLDLTYRGIRLGQRVADQPGRQQYGTPVDAEGWRGHVQRPVPGGGIIEERKRGGKIP